MKKITKAALVLGAGAAAIAMAAPANAEYSWVADESASICNSLSLTSSGYDWMSIEISSLQLSQDVSRSEAVTGIRQAAVGYCPQYLSVVPAR